MSAKTNIWKVLTALTAAVVALFSGSAKAVQPETQPLVDRLANVREHLEQKEVVNNGVLPETEVKEDEPLLSYSWDSWYNWNNWTNSTY